jgi:DNA-directed RNA polymerase sigma subunit (sigma70/sigma32)
MDLSKCRKRRRQVKVNYLLPQNIDWSLLNEKEITLVKMRWGHDPYTKKHNHREIAEATNSKVHRVSRLEKMILKKLRKT